VAISPNDQVLAYQNSNLLVQLLSISDRSQTEPVSGKLPRGDPFSPNSDMIGILQIQDGKNILNLYSLPTNSTGFISKFKLLDLPITASIKDTVNSSINYSPDGNILTAFARGDLKYWSTVTGLELKEALPKREGSCYTIYKISPSDPNDQRFIVAGTENGVLYSESHLKDFCQIPRDARTISEKFLYDGSIIVLSLQNQLVEVYDVASSAKKDELKIKTPGDVWDATVSKDGAILAAASNGGAIELYDLKTMTHIKTLEIGTGPVYQVLFSNNSKYLIAGLADGTLRFFGIQP
jgi:WD40 repeat protein